MNRIIIKSLSGVFATGLLALVGIFAFCQTAQAETKDLPVDVKILSSVSLGIANCDGTLDPSSFDLTLSPNTFVSNCQTLTVGTNAPGYTLSAQATSADTTNALNYLNPTTLGTAPTIPSTTSSISSPAVLPNSTWGFAVTSDVDLSSSPVRYFDSTYTPNDATNIYANLPATNTEIYKTEQFPGAPNNFNFYYATTVGFDKPAGTYATTVTYTVTAEMVPCQWNPSIPFDDPGCFEPTIACVTGPAFKGNNLGNIIDSATITQDWEIGNTGIVTDERNNQNYCIGKLADNNIWMLNNLRIANYSATAQDTDLNTGAAATAGFTIPALGNSSIISHDIPYVYGPIPDKNGNNSTTISYDSTDIASEYFGGYLYNWPSATAGESQTSMPDGSGNAPNSICPKNWRLPVRFTDFPNLDIAFGGTGSSHDGSESWVFSGPWRGASSGMLESGLGYMGQGSGALYWEATVYNGAAASIMSFNIWGVGFSGAARYIGFSVRCLLD